jgi:hypothetical protein
MKLITLFGCCVFAALPAVSFGATCPGTVWNKPFPGANTVSGNTCTSTNSIANMCATFEDSPGNDDVYQWVGDGSAISVTVTPAAGFDVGVQVLTGTCGTGGTCVSGGGSADTGGDGAAETVTLTSVNATTYYFVIYSSQTGADNCGTYNITGNLPVTLEKFSVD